MDIIETIKEFGFQSGIAIILLVFILKNYTKLQDKLIDQDKDSTK